MATPAYAIEFDHTVIPEKPAVFRFEGPTVVGPGHIDVSYLAFEVGFRVPVQLTERLWDDAVAWTSRDSTLQVRQDQHSRLWALLYAAWWTIRYDDWIPQPYAFDLERIPRDGRSTQEVRQSYLLNFMPWDDPPTLFILGMLDEQ